MKSLIFSIILALSLCLPAIANQQLMLGQLARNNVSSGSTTYGATSTGSLGRFEGVLDAYARPITISSGGTLTKIGGYFTSASGVTRGVKLALYTNNAGTPGTQVAVEIELTVSANATDEQLEGSYHNSSISPGDYWIGFVSSYAQTGATYENGGAGDRPRATPLSVYDLEANWGDMTPGSTGTILLALYVVVE